MRLALPVNQLPNDPIIDTSIAPSGEILARPHGSLELKYLRAKVQAKRTAAPLFNTRLWVYHMEVGLLEAWKRYLLSVKTYGSPPQSKYISSPIVQSPCTGIVKSQNYDSSPPYPLNHIRVRDLLLS